MALIKDRLKLESTMTPGGTGQFDVIADGELIAKRGGNWLTRQFGMGYPDMAQVVDRLERRLSESDSSN